MPSTVRGLYAAIPGLARARRAASVILIATAVLLALAFALGAGALPALAQTNSLDQKAREIAATLRCPVCQNLSVADSPSPLATQMRAIIQQKVQAGESRDAITRYFVERYGEEILLQPPFAGFSLLVWLGAFAGVAVIALVVGARVRSALSGNPARAASYSSPMTPLEREHYEALLDAELARYKQVGR